MLFKFFVASLTVIVLFFWFVGKISNETKSLSFNHNLGEGEQSIAMADAELGNTALLSNFNQETTDLFTKKLVEKYILPDNLSDEDILAGSLDEELIEVLDGKIEEVKYYSSADFKILDDNSEEILSKYKSDLLSLINEVYYEGLGAENIVFSLTALDETPTHEEHTMAHDSLMLSSETYTLIAKKLHELEVPKHYLDRHIKMTNAYIDLSSGVSYMAQSMFDPIYSVPGVQLYMKAYSIILDLEDL